MTGSGDDQSRRSNGEHSTAIQGRMVAWTLEVAFTCGLGKKLECWKAILGGALAGPGDMLDVWSVGCSFDLCVMRSQVGPGGVCSYFQL